MTTWFLILALSTSVPMESRAHCLRAAEAIHDLTGTVTFCVSNKGKVVQFTKTS